MTKIKPVPATPVSAVVRRPRQAGFTLLEIIVVVLVFSVMAAMAYGGLNSVLRTRNGIEQSMNRTAEFQRTFMRLRTDLQNLRDRPARDSYGDPEPALSYAEDGVLRLVRGGWRSPLDSGRSSMERVSFVRSAANGRRWVEVLRLVLKHHLLLLLAVRLQLQLNLQSLTR